MMKIALVFPGQGSQSVGMGRDLYDNFNSAKEVFEEACDSIRFDLKKLCFDGPADQLSDTHNTQPALLTVSIAAYRVLVEKSGLEADFMAGHSLGEYSALCASQTLDFSEAVKLVRFRGKVMSEAASESIGSMAAILGLKRDNIKAAIEEVKGSEVLTVANYNCQSQIILSGHKTAVERAMVVCKQKGATRVLPLKVSGPFHTELMDEPSKKLKSKLDKIEFKEPACKVYSNVTAKPYGSADDIAPLLVEQIKSSVMWEDSVKEILEGGADMFIEVGPGNVLSGLIKRIVKDAVICNVYDTGSLKNSIATYNKRLSSQGDL